MPTALRLLLAACLVIVIAACIPFTTARVLPVPHNTEVTVTAAHLVADDPLIEIRSGTLRSITIENIPGAIVRVAHSTVTAVIIPQNLTDARIEIVDSSIHLLVSRNLTGPAIDARYEDDNAPPALQHVRTHLNITRCNFTFFSNVGSPAAAAPGAPSNATLGAGGFALKRDFGLSVRASLSHNSSLSLVGNTFDFDNHGAQILDPAANGGRGERRNEFVSITRFSAADTSLLAIRNNTVTVHESARRLFNAIRITYEFVSPDASVDIANNTITAPQLACAICVASLDSRDIHSRGRVYGFLNFSGAISVVDNRITINSDEYDDHVSSKVVYLSIDREDAILDVAQVRGMTRAASLPPWGVFVLRNRIHVHYTSARADYPRCTPGPGPGSCSVALKVARQMLFVRSRHLVLPPSGGGGGGGGGGAGLQVCENTLTASIDPAVTKSQQTLKFLLWNSTLNFDGIFVQLMGRSYLPLMNVSRNIIDIGGIVARNIWSINVRTVFFSWRNTSLSIAGVFMVGSSKKILFENNTIGRASTDATFTRNYAGVEMRCGPPIRDALVEARYNTIRLLARKTIGWSPHFHSGISVEPYTAYKTFIGCKIVIERNDIEYAGANDFGAGIVVGTAGSKIVDGVFVLENRIRSTQLFRAAADTGTTSDANQQQQGAATSSFGAGVFGIYTCGFFYHLDDRLGATTATATAVGMIIARNDVVVTASARVKTNFYSFAIYSYTTKKENRSLGGVAILNNSAHYYNVNLESPQGNAGAISVLLNNVQIGGIDHIVIDGNDCVVEIIHTFRYLAVPIAVVASHIAERPIGLLSVSRNRIRVRGPLALSAVMFGSPLGQTTDLESKSNFDVTGGSIPTNLNNLRIWLTGTRPGYFAVARVVIASNAVEATMTEQCGRFVGLSVLGVVNRVGNVTPAAAAAAAFDLEFSNNSFILNNTAATHVAGVGSPGDPTRCDVVPLWFVKPKSYNTLLQPITQPIAMTLSILFQVTGDASIFDIGKMLVRDSSFELHGGFSLSMPLLTISSNRTDIANLTFSNVSLKIASPGSAPPPATFRAFGVDGGPTHVGGSGTADLTSLSESATTLVTARCAKPVRDGSSGSVIMQWQSISFFANPSDFSRNVDVGCAAGDLRTATPSRLLSDSRETLSVTAPSRTASHSPSPTQVGVFVPEYFLPPPGVRLAAAMITAVSSPTTLQRSFAVMTSALLRQCGNTSINKNPLDASSNLFGLTIHFDGDDYGVLETYRGALVSQALLVFPVISLLLFLAIAFFKWKKQLATWAAAAAVLRFPGSLHPGLVFAALPQSVTIAAVFSADARRDFDFLIAIPTLLLFGLLPAVCGVWLMRRISAINEEIDDEGGDVNSSNSNSNSKKNKIVIVDRVEEEALEQKRELAEKKRRKRRRHAARRRAAYRPPHRYSHHRTDLDEFSSSSSDDGGDDDDGRSPSRRSDSSTDTEDEEERQRPKPKSSGLDLIEAFFAKIYVMLFASRRYWQPTPFVHTVGIAFDMCDRPWYSPFEYFFACLLGVLGGLSLTCVSGSCCQALAIASLVLNALYLIVACAVLRPWLCLADRGIGNGMSALGAIAASLTLAEKLGIVTVGSALNVVLKVAFYSSLVAGVVMFVPILEIPLVRAWGQLRKRIGRQAGRGDGGEDDDDAQPMLMIPTAKSAAADGGRATTTFLPNASSTMSYRDQQRRLVQTSGLLRMSPLPSASSRRRDYDPMPRDDGGRDRRQSHSQPRAGSSRRDDPRQQLQQQQQQQQHHHRRHSPSSPSSPHHHHHHHHHHQQQHRDHRNRVPSSPTTPRPHRSESNHHKKSTRSRKEEERSPSAARAAANEYWRSVIEKNENRADLL